MRFNVGAVTLVADSNGASRQESALTCFKSGFHFLWSRV